MYKDLFLHSEIQGFSMYSFRHCDVVGVTRSPCILINNIKEAVSVREETYRKVIRLRSDAPWDAKDQPVMTQELSM